MRLKMAAFATVLMIPRPSVAAAFAVDSVGDQSDSNPGDGTCATSGGSCTLRAALEEANATAGPHTIDFAIAGAGPHIVKPTTELPAFTEAIALDGYSQAGATEATDTEPANLRIAIDARNVVGSTNPDADTPAGLTLAHDGSSVRGLSVFGSSGDAIRVTHGSGIVIEGNHIGCDPSGTLPLPNGEGGIRVTALGLADVIGTVSIGGDTAAQRNVVGASAVGGILIDTATSATVSGNYVGIGADGETVMPNGYGIGIGEVEHALVQGNTIGGNVDEGLIAQGSLAVEIHDNIVGYDALGAPTGTGPGVSLEAETADVQGNVIRASATGLFTALVDSLTLADNQVTAASFDVLVTGNAELFGNLLEATLNESDGSIGGLVPGFEFLVGSLDAQDNHFTTLGPVAIHVDSSDPSSLTGTTLQAARGVLALSGTGGDANLTGTVFDSNTAAFLRLEGFGDVTMASTVIEDVGRAEIGLDLSGHLDLIDNRITPTDGWIQIAASGSLFHEWTNNTFTGMNDLTAELGGGLVSSANDIATRHVYVTGASWRSTDDEIESYGGDDDDYYGGQTFVFSSGVVTTRTEVTTDGPAFWGVGGNVRFEQSVFRGIYESGIGNAASWRLTAGGNVSFIGGSYTGSTARIDAQGHRVLMTDLTADAAVGAEGLALQILAEDATIDGSHFVGAGFPESAFTGSLTVTGTTFHRTWGFEVESAGATVFRGNTVTGVNTAVEPTYWSFAGNTLAVEDNSFTGLYKIDGAHGELGTSFTGNAIVGNDGSLVVSAAQGTLHASGNSIEGLQGSLHLSAAGDVLVDGTNADMASSTDVLVCSDPVDDLCAPEDRYALVVRSSSGSVVGSNFSYRGGEAQVGIEAYGDVLLPGASFTNLQMNPASSSEHTPVLGVWTEHGALDLSGAQIQTEGGVVRAGADPGSATFANATMTGPSVALWLGVTGLDITGASIEGIGGEGFYAISAQDHSADGLTIDHVTGEVALVGAEGHLQLDNATFTNIGGLVFAGGATTALNHGTFTDIGGGIALCPDTFPLPIPSGFLATGDAVVTNNTFARIANPIGVCGHDIEFTNNQGTDVSGLLLGGEGQLTFTASRFDELSGTASMIGTGGALIDDVQLNTTGLFASALVGTDVSVNNLHIVGDNGSGVDNTGMVAAAEGGSVIFTNSSFERFGAVFAATFGTGDVTVADCQLTDAVGFIAGAEGGGTATIRNVVATDTAALFAFGNHVSFHDNTISGWSFAGAEGLASATIHHNTLTDGGTGGEGLGVFIAGAEGGDAVVQDNSVLGAEGFFSLAGGDLLFADNEFVNITGDGQISAELGLTLTDNTFTAIDGELAVAGEGATSTLFAAGNAFTQIGSELGLGAEGRVEFVENLVRGVGDDVELECGPGSLVQDNTFDDMESVYLSVNSDQEAPFGQPALVFAGNSVTNTYSPNDSVEILLGFSTSAARIEDNTFTDLAGPILVAAGAIEFLSNTVERGHAVWLEGETEVSALDNLVTGQVRPETGENVPPIALYAVGAIANVERNEVHDNALIGAVAYALEGRARLVGNTAHGNLYAGLATAGDQATVEDNVADGNNGAGLVVNFTNGTITGNHTNDNLYNGILVNWEPADEYYGNPFDEAPPVVTGNTVQNNGVSGLVYGSAPLDVSDNRFGANGGLAIDLAATQQSSAGIPAIFDGVSPLAPAQSGTCGLLDSLSYEGLARGTLTEVTRANDGTLHVKGTACPEARVELYLAHSDDLLDDGHGEGLEPLGFAIAQQSGAFSFAIPNPAFVLEGPIAVSTLAYTVELGTSEFSNNLDVPSCGDGLLDERFEACDDGGHELGDGCSAVCEAEEGWDCDSGPGGVCTSECGDGRVAVGAEQCDDDNLDSGDGCAEDCTIEPGFDCAGEVCVTTCGDGLVLGDEACDDGNSADGDGCSSTCALSPDSVVLTGPADPSGMPEATFTFHDPTGLAVAFECREDGASWVGCTDPTGDVGVFEYDWRGTLDDQSTHTFEVRGVATDGTPDAEPGAWTWSVDFDADADGIAFGSDNCPEIANPDQADQDLDALGDACDDDIDGDGLKNAQEDVDGDGEVDGRETDPLSPDTDQDGLCDGWVDGPLLDSQGGVLCDGGEDADLDGVTDPDETDPTAFDSDGDCIGDGDEVLQMGTDPLDEEAPGSKCPVDEEEPSGCGCETSPSPAALLWLAPLLAGLRRRR